MAWPRGRQSSCEAQRARRARPDLRARRGRGRSPTPSPDARPGAACSSRGSRSGPARRAGTRSCRRRGSSTARAARCAAVGHRGAQRGVDGRGGRLLDDLLVPALDRALALAEVDDACRGASPKHLHLDVARPFEVALEVDAAVAEGGRRLARRRRRRASASSSTRRTMRMPLPPPPAAALMSDGIAERGGGLRERAPASGARTGVAGTTGTPAFSTRARAAILSPMVAIACGRRADEREAGIARRRAAKRAFSARKP